MKRDKARVWTDKQLDRMERRLRKIYGQAKRELGESWKAFMREQESYIKSLQTEYYAAKAAGFDAEARELGKQLGIAKKDLTLGNEHYKALVDKTTSELAGINQKAVSYLNGQMPSVYVKNYNQIAGQAAKVGVKFDMINEDVVRHMVNANDIKLPNKKVNVPKDMRWNSKKLNSSVLQGIIQGESMDKIADRILPIVDSNKSAAIRNARTMVTGAENGGRLDSYHRLEKDGVILEKGWMATMDDRVRESHAELDGEYVGIDDPFSNGLMYPGDPDGDPEEVYNCRCTMVTRIVAFKGRRI